MIEAGDDMIEVALRVRSGVIVVALRARRGDLVDAIFLQLTSSPVLPGPLPFIKSLLSNDEFTWVVMGAMSMVGGWTSLDAVSITGVGASLDVVLTMGVWTSLGAVLT